MVFEIERFFTHTNERQQLIVKKTMKSTNESIKNTEVTLRNLTENQEFLNIDKVLKTNAEATKRQLQHRKFKKFDNLKYKLQPIKEQTPVII